VVRTQLEYVDPNRRQGQLQSAGDPLAREPVSLRDADKRAGCMVGSTRPTRRRLVQAAVWSSATDVDQARPDVAPPRKGLELAGASACRAVENQLTGKAPTLTWQAGLPGHLA
jgi:hypothetical protein